MSFFWKLGFSLLSFCEAFQPMNVKFKFNDLEFDKVNKYVDNSLNFYDKVLIDRLKDEESQNKKNTNQRTGKGKAEGDNMKLLCHKDFLDAKSYLIKNLENKYIKYIGLYNITNADTDADEEFIFQNTSPLIFVFIKIVPIINTISIEGILPNIYKNDRNFNKKIIPISKAYLLLLSKQSQLILDYHNLKYFADGKYFLEFEWHESELN